MVDEINGDFTEYCSDNCNIHDMIAVFNCLLNINNKLVTSGNKNKYYEDTVSDLLAHLEKDILRKQEILIDEAISSTGL